MTEHIQQKHNGLILELIINRPDKKNAISLAMYTALSAALTKADSDPNVRCVVLHGVGDSFTSGNDLADFASADLSSSSTP